MTPQSEALRIIEDVLKELESSRGSVLSAVQKLLRASTLSGDTDVQNWCAIQLGDQKLVNPLKVLLTILTSKADHQSPQHKASIKDAIESLTALNLKHEIHYTDEEIAVKAPSGGGGYINIGFIEERYADLVRMKRGNDGTYYKNTLNNHLNYVRKKAHDFASNAFNRLKFAGTVSSCFDVLKNAVDDKLLDLNPELAEQLMLTFKRVSSTNSEDWSQALTTCRRFLESLADQLYPAASEAQTMGRALKQSQYVNRLWAFMDKAIESDSNKELAKAHVDFLGSWMEKTNKLTNKGVHAEVTQLEAVKAVFHTYLTVADIIEYLENAPQKQKIDINIASIDEIEALLDVSRSTAKEIIKARIQNGKLDKLILSKVAGVGPKTLDKAIAAFSL